MSNEVESSKRVMWLRLQIVKDLAEDAVTQIPLMAIGDLEVAMEQHLALLAEDRSRMTEERDALRNRVQVLESANKIAGDRLRTISETQELLGAISHQDKPQNVYGEAMDSNTAAILGAVVDVQRIVRDWSIETTKPREAMRLIAEVVYGSPINAALFDFEFPEYFTRMVCDFKFDHGAERSVSYHKVTKCQHSFHPKSLAGEMCTFCGVAK